MKLSLKLRIYLVSILLICSCTQQVGFEGSQKINALPIKDTIRSQTIYLDEITELLNVGYVGHVGDYLVVVNIKDEGIFQVFKLPEVKFLYAWGNQGDGPDEFKQPIVHNSINTTNEELIVYDPYLNKLRFFAVTDTNLVSTGEKIINYDYYRGVMNRLVRLNDNLYVKQYPPSMVGNEINQNENIFSRLRSVFSRDKYSEYINSEYIAFDPTLRDTLFTFGKYPNSHFDPRERYRKFSKIHKPSPNGLKFSVFYLNYNQFKIYNDWGKKLYHVEVHDSSIDLISKNKDNFIFRNQLYNSNDYIYALALNSLYDDISDRGEKFQSSLEIWSWEGEPIYRTLFDKRIVLFTVSEKYGKVYGISDYVSNEIYVYDLPNLVN